MSIDDLVAGPRDRRHFRLKRSFGGYAAQQFTRGLMRERWFTVARFSHEADAANFVNFCNLSYLPEAEVMADRRARTSYAFYRLLPAEGGYRERIFLSALRYWLARGTEGAHLAFGKPYAERGWFGRCRVYVNGAKGKIWLATCSRRREADLLIAAYNQMRQPAAPCSTETISREIEDMAHEASATRARASP